MSTEILKHFNEIEQDIFEGFHKRTMNLKNNEKATLIFKDCEPKTDKAILYIHGLGDYFFREELANKIVEGGYSFYAIDLRGCGRSIVEKPNFFSNNLEDYFEEINLAILYIKHVSNIENIVLYGHSLGGLVVSLYANKGKYRENIKSIILNSPFFFLPVAYFDGILLKLTIPFLTNIFSDFINKKKIHYGQLLHKAHGGEWDFNINWTGWSRPMTEPVPTTFIDAVVKAQNRLKKHSNIKHPVLLLSSDKSGNIVNIEESFDNSDVLLDIKEMSKFASNLGSRITIIRVENAIHDVFLSKKEVREAAYAELFRWMDTYA